MKEKIRSTIAYAAGPLLGVVSGPILARSLGPDGRGQFAAIMQPITLATTVASFGIPTAITYFITRGVSRRRIKTLAFYSLLLTSTITYCFLIIYAFYLSKTQGINARTLYLIWCFIFVSVAIEFRRSLLLGYGDTKKIDTERFVFSILRLSCILIAWKFLSITSVHLALMLLITFAITSIFLWLPKATYKDRSDEIQFREFKAYVFPAAAVSISSIMVARLDQMLLPLQATSEEVGYYAIAVTFAEVPSIFTLLVSRAALQSSSVGDSFSIQIRKTRFYIFLGLLLISVLSMISFPVIIHVFGPAFEPSYSIILVLMLSSTLSLPNALIISSLCGSGNVLKAALVSSSALLPIVAGFIVSWGRINGYQAAWITFQSQFLILILGIFFVLRKRYQVA